MTHLTSIALIRFRLVKPWWLLSCCFLRLPSVVMTIRGDNCDDGDDDGGDDGVDGETPDVLVTNT